MQTNCGFVLAGGNGFGSRNCCCSGNHTRLPNNLCLCWHCALCLSRCSSPVFLLTDRFKTSMIVVHRSMSDRKVSKTSEPLMTVSRFCSRRAMLLLPYGNAEPSCSTWNQCARKSTWFSNVTERSIASDTLAARMVAGAHRGIGTQFERHPAAIRQR